MRMARVDRGLLKTFNAEDIAHPLKLEFGAEPWQFESSEGYMLEYRDKYPDKFIWSATVNPLIENFRDRWIGKFARGLRAVVLFPGLKDHSLEHENVTWLLEQLEERGIKGVMMSFENVNRTNTSADYIKQLYEMIDGHPKLHYSFMHTGYQVPHMLERDEVLKLINHFNEKYGNVWAQTGNYYLDTRYPFPKQLEGTKDSLRQHRVGADRLGHRLALDREHRQVLPVCAVGARELHVHERGGTSEVLGGQRSEFFGLSFVELMP